MALVPLVLYAAAAVVYGLHFARRSPRTGRVATAVLSAGVLAHTFLIGMQTMEAGHAPLVGTTSAISAFVWLLALAYLYTELTTEERAMGMLVAGLLAGGAHTPPRPPPAPPPPRGGARPPPPPPPPPPP